MSTPLAHFVIMSSNTAPDADDRDREMLPDERAVITNRLDFLDNASRRVSVTHVAQDLGFDYLLDDESDEEDEY